eukprot:COSAG01_NODE_362_length_18130_cov_34.672307_2_plen_724_part_00
MALLGLFQALARSLDVVTDPAIAFWTDTMRSKWGRRKPFLVGGCLPYGLCIVLLMTPPVDLGPVGVSIWFGATYILYFLMWTVTVIPYDALAPELTDNPEDRSRLFLLCSIFDGIGSLVAVTLPVGLVKVVKWWRAPDFSSCGPPANRSVYSSQTFSIGLSSCSTHMSEKRKQMSWTISSAEIIVGLDADKCLSDVFNVSQGRYAGHPDENSFCNCTAICAQATELDNTRTSYFAVGCFFGLWYVVSMLNCSHRVKERSQLATSKLPDPSPIVPTLLRTFNNRPFNLLLPAWVCDALVNATVAALMPYFVIYIVQPEFQTLADGNGRECHGGANQEWRCQSPQVLGACVLALLLCASLATPAWYGMRRCFGKRSTWLLWSLSMACTNPLFLIIEKGDVHFCIIIAAVNGIPFGAKWLADDILADVIDYDEFLTGNRAEATYTMFKSFLPKVAAIPASALPIAMLEIFGYKEPIDGVYQEQVGSDGVKLRWYITSTIIFLPTTLSLLAFMLKLRFPIHTREQIMKISEGIGAHVLGASFKDPISGVSFHPPEQLVDSDLGAADLLDTFPGMQPVLRLLNDVQDGLLALKNITQFQLTMSLGLMIAAIISFAFTAHVLVSDDPDLQRFQVVPVLVMVLFGVSINLVVFTCKRWYAGRRLQMEWKAGTDGVWTLPDGSHCSRLLERIISKRTEIAATKQLDTGVVSGLRSLCMSIRQGMRSRQRGS